MDVSENYLCRIGKERTAQCQKCGADRDSAQHTLKKCLSAEAERRDQEVDALGNDLFLGAVIKAATRDGSK